MVRITSVLLGFALFVGLTSTVSAGSSSKSSHNNKKSRSDRYGWDSRECNSCYEEQWEYCSETCDAYGSFGDSDYSTPATASCDGKYGMIGFSDSIKLHRPDVKDRYVSQLGAHFALCDEYNTECHAAKFQLGLYEQQQKHKKNINTWKLVAQTKWLRFQDHCDEYQLFDVDRECDAFEMCSKTNYRVGMLVAAGSELTVFSSNTTKTPAFTSYQPAKNNKYGNNRKNLPYKYQVPVCDSYLALEMVLCNNPVSNSTNTNSTKY
jgi:hypothetical protein